MERENVPTFAANAPGIEFGFGNKIAPRFGVSCDVMGDGKLKLYASSAGSTTVQVRAAARLVRRRQVPPD